MTAVLDTARIALELGYCPMPAKADGSKAPAGPWKRRQSTRPSLVEVDLEFADVDGIGLVCGVVSGGLEMFELEGRAVDAGLDEQLTDAMEAAGLGTLWTRVVEGYLERTPSGGIHLLWCCSHVDGNQKLAVDEDGQVLIETRGEGGFTIIAPSNGMTHPTGKPWVLVAGGLDTVAIISPDEREQLLDVARTFDRTPPRSEPAPPVERPVASTRTDSWMDAVVDAFDRATSWAEILEGWSHHHRHGDVDYWTRPGKDPKAGHSATTNANGTDRLIVFSSSVPGFETADGNGPAPSYDRFGTWANLHHHGDRLRAAQAARDAGHGPAWEPRTVVDEAGLLELAGAPHSPGMSDEERKGWAVVDLGPVLDGIRTGTIVRQVPTIGLVEGGGPGLFVAGKVNGIHGGPATGKTMAMQIVTRQLVERGDVVWVIDFEDNETSWVLRLLDLGTEPDAIRRNLRYRNPDQVLDDHAAGQLHIALEHDRPTLVIVDSTGEWLGLHGVEDKDAAIARFMATCARPLTATGAAAVLLDHVPHAERERLAPIGSQRKLAAVNGCQYLITTIAEMARGKVGKARLTVAKDRTGTRPKGTVAAEILLDATTDPGIGRLIPATENTTASDDPLQGLRPAAKRIHAVLATADEPLAVPVIGDHLANDGTTGTGLKARTIQDGLKALEDAGLAVRTPMGIADLWSRAQPVIEQKENTP